LVSAQIFQISAYYTCKYIPFKTGKSNKQQQVLAYLRKCKSEQETDASECCPTIKGHVKKFDNDFKWKNTEDNELKNIAKKLVQNGHFKEIRGSCADEGKY
jgi:hypothetical protein